MSWTWMEIPWEWRVSHMMLALSVRGPPTAAAPGLWHQLLLWPRHAVDVGGHLGALDALRGATSTLVVGRSDPCTL